MKQAVDKTGQAVIAGEDAPQTAVCPVCGHEVVLRRRRLMNGRGSVYFWRHMPGASLACKRRSGFNSHRSSD